MRVSVSVSMRGMRGCKRRIPMTPPGTLCGGVHEQQLTSAAIGAGDAVNTPSRPCLRALRHALHPRHAPPRQPPPLLLGPLPAARLGGAAARGGRRMTSDRDVILRAADVAKWLHISPRHVLRLDIPRLNLGHRTVLFRERDVQAWIQRSEEHTSEL